MVQKQKLSDVTQWKESNDIPDPKRIEGQIDLTVLESQFDDYK